MGGSALRHQIVWLSRRVATMPSSRLLPHLGKMPGQGGPGSADRSGERGGSAVGITPDQ
jgi:hypothetical protein